MPGLEPERAPVIVAGAVIVREVLARYGLAALEASEHDILHGAALAAAELPAARRRRRSAGRLHLLLMQLRPRRRRTSARSRSRRTSSSSPRAPRQAGWEALFLWDHLAWVWDGPAVDPWVTLGAVAVRTERLLLGTA